MNASAGFMRQGVAGVLSNDLVLTIGLPLVAGLTVRQLGGVLAHEFGHFAQGGGMRLTAIVRGVNAWFARVVFERDEWDLRLEQWSKNLDGRVAILLWLAKGRSGCRARCSAGSCWPATRSAASCCGRWSSTPTVTRSRLPAARPSGRRPAGCGK